MKELELKVKKIEPFDRISDILVHSDGGLYNLLIPTASSTWDLLLIDRDAEPGEKTELKTGHIKVIGEDGKTFHLRIHKIPVWDTEDDSEDDSIVGLCEVIANLLTYRKDYKTKKTPPRDENGFIRLTPTRRGSWEIERRTKEGITPSLAMETRMNVAYTMSHRLDKFVRLVVLDNAPDDETEFVDGIVVLYQALLKRPRITYNTYSKNYRVKLFRYEDTGDLKAAHEVSAYLKDIGADTFMIETIIDNLSQMLINIGPSKRSCYDDDYV